MNKGNKISIYIVMTDMNEIEIDMNGAETWRKNNNVCMISAPKNDWWIVGI